MRYRNEKAEPLQPGHINQPPTATKGTAEVIIQKRGGTGTAAKLTPDPRHPHSPKPQVQGVC
jgi:hypothetical protein